MARGIKSPTSVKINLAGSASFSVSMALEVCEAKAATAVVIDAAAVGGKLWIEETFSSWIARIGLTPNQMVSNFVANFVDRHPGEVASIRSPRVLVCCGESIWVESKTLLLLL